VSGGLLRRLLGRGGEPSRDDDREYRIRLVVGLGNPGGEYAGTRHNVGFWTINRLAKRHGIELSTSGQTALGQGRIGGRDVALAKPRTFVNLSGDAVWNLIKRLKLDDAQELLIVCDDLDLPTAKLRLRPHGGSGGYKGLQSIIDVTKSDRFPRLRIGIGRPVVGGKPSWDPEDVSSYVLSDPPPSERAELDDAVARAVEAIEVAITEGFEVAMSRYNA
jgi:PTH1 family peptidyl-tRNA hydrolase